MSVGRPPKSLQEKILSGSRIRTDRDAEAIDANKNVSINIPACPRWLKGAGRKHWDTLAPALMDAGLISEIDGDVFAMHCDNVAKYGEVMEKLEDIDAWLAKTPNGFEVQSGLVQIRNKLQEQILKTASEFGLTPKARSGVKVGQSKQPSLFGDVPAEVDPYASFGIRQ